MEPHDRDRFDQWLDRALLQYGVAEHREGLEDRILATLQAQQRTHARRAWAWALGGATATILSVLFLWHGLDHSDLGKHDVLPVVHTSQDSAVEHRAQILPPISQKSTVRVSKWPHPAVTEHNSSPRLEQFPSLRPLSPEEMAVLQYAQQYPQEATLVAKEQQKFSDEVRQAQEEVESGSASSNE